MAKEKNKGEFESLIVDEIIMNDKIRREIKSIFAGKSFEELYPLVDIKFSIIIENTTRIANAIRRVITDELKSYFLDFDHIIDTNDEFIKDFPLQICLNNIPISYEVLDAEDLQFSINIENKTDRAVMITSGDIITNKPRNPVIFNKNFGISMIMPKKYLKVEKIKLRHEQQNNKIVCCRATIETLDIEQIKEKDIINMRDLTEDEGIIPADMSGYKVSSLIAEPKRFKLTAIIPAIIPGHGYNIAKMIINDAISNIKSRLQKIKSDIEDNLRTLIFNDESKSQFCSFSLENETFSVIEIICDILKEDADKIRIVNYKDNHHGFVININFVIPIINSEIKKYICERISYAISINFLRRDPHSF